MKHIIYSTLTFLVMTVTESSLPDLSWDHYTEDMVKVSPYVQHIYDIRYNNEDKPDHCRNDLCEEYPDRTDRRGTFIWQKTTVGFRQYIRCPYDVTGGNYGYRDCNYSNGTDPLSRASWGESVIDHCPEPPLTEVLKTTKKQLAKNETREESWWQMSFASVLDTVREYPDYPIFDDNVQDTFSFVYTVVTKAVSNDQAPHTSTVDVMFRCLDWVAYLDHGRYALTNYNDKIKVIWMFTVLSEMVEIPPGEHELVIPGNLAYIHVQLSNNLYLENQEFQSRYPGKANLMNTNVSIHFQNEDLRLVRILYMALPDYLPYSVTFFDTMRFMGIDPDDDVFGVEFEAALQMRDLSLIGPLLYMSVSNDPEEDWSMESWMSKMSVSDEFTVIYEMVANTEFINNEDPDPRCGQSEPNLNTTEYGVNTNWYGTHCEEIYDESGGITCYCNVTGFLSVLDLKGRFTVSFSDGWGGYDYDGVPPDRDIATFMGFPFSYELYITSHVLRAISLVCLVATILSFLIYRKTRRGTPTKILLNLCVSLIVLLVSLYITEVIAGSRIGCRISNILRYYLIMVSLMWNGVEATNMYLMLVKVFNHDIHRFILKAGIVAWGVPLVMVGCVLAYSVKGFDGIYLDTCEFRCQLRDPVLYYFFLLPMGLIILYNLIIFVMVLKVIIQSSSIPSTNERRRNHFMRLCGALSTMVLLGVPWVFSAFGAIDASDDQFTLQKMEGIFHVIFVVFVNLQGVFIFLFHCARNADVRQQWRSTFSRTQSTSVSKSRGSTSQEVSGNNRRPSEHVSNTKL